MRFLLTWMWPIFSAIGCVSKDEVGDSPDPTADCPDEAAPLVDWLEPGPHPVGWQTHEATTSLRDLTLTRSTVVYYPATESSEDAAVETETGPHSVVFFEHAGGAHYLAYETLFQHLASHGIAVISIDHNALDGSTGWGSADFWDGHDALFQDTIEEMIGWSRTPGHPYEGLIHEDQMGLAGHSHGTALRTMQHYRPMSTTAEHTIQSVGLLAPCPDEPAEDYLEVYGGMPPLQVIYGSRDQDGCVAYGQSIAVFEAGDNPRHFVHLEGGSHYGFTDDGALLDATISREDHQDIAMAGLLAWWKYTLEGDTQSLPYLRGDRPLVPSGPHMRNQYIEAEPLVVDTFGSPIETVLTFDEVPAITGIDGQTYVNGFLSDTFVNVEAGVSLVLAEMESLLDAAASTDGTPQVLFFVDQALGPETYGLALDELESSGAIEATRVTDHGAFVSQLAMGGWDLVISATQTGSASDENPSDGPLADWICSGGRAIVSDYRMDSAGAAAVLACSQTHFGDATNYETMYSDGPLFADPMDLQNPGWGFFAVGLVSDGASIFAHALVEGTEEATLGANALGFVPTHSGLDRVQGSWMYDDARGVYHPNWGLEIAWSEPGGSIRHVLSDGDGLDTINDPVLSFRILQLANDALNPSGEDQDFHIQLEDATGTTASVPLSSAPQGALRPNLEIGSGTAQKSVYETYRFPLSLFTEVEPTLDTRRLIAIEWVFEPTESGAVVLDDLVFTQSGRCE
jgi:hypothetical protein